MAGETMEFEVKGGLLSRAARYWKMGSASSRKGLPLLLASPLSPNEDETGPVEKVVDVMSITVNQLLEHLHGVTKYLDFWQKLSEGEDNEKLSFMMFERGPWAFFQGIKLFIRASFVEASPGKELIAAASARISERVAVLADLRERLATVTGQVHIEVDKMGEKVSNGQKSRLASSECTVAVLKALSVLEGGYRLPQKDYYNHGVLSQAVTIVLDFEEIPDILACRLEWSNNELDDALKLVSDNMWKLQNFLDTVMWQYRRPRKVVRNWIQYTGGALGLGIVSSWLFRHSRLGGSSDLDQWTKESVQAASSFLEEHVQQPLQSIRDDLFDTFHKRHRVGHELGDVQLTAESLHRMLKEFVAQTKGNAAAENSSEQQLMELMMSRYETELTHPVRNIFGGELARALLIQVQKLKLDVETAMLDLNQILRANEINFAVLAAMPAFLVALFVGWLLKKPFTEDVKRAEGRGRKAQLLRRMLMVNVENAIMTFQMCVDEDQEDAFAQFGTLIYSLDRLHKAVKKPAIESGEWSSLEKDIVELAKPRLSTYYKLAIAGRMERVYEILVPMPKLR
ncbi:protein DGS1, mitochondrial isoform X2 [Physcomitrium patens]|uniref:Uncharacterized protein n=1 Tax=Physcomitrium patens TaxID=3218 RepID=A0A2K1ILW9_PHYPA|nr:protein DGS1, mitochondrial-like isoform X1 [Physcomitrium patens]PNR30271.1 hypothetical protein PHYPA_026587 [Physcomitrium patens]|eukprot:XP_024360120.1 protein DGS1, mitochondrial-like isoform X1 [Physcomitrella patens]